MIGTPTAPSKSAAVTAGAANSQGPSGFTIIPVWDASVTNSANAAQFESAVNAAISKFEAVITTNETITIDFGYGVMAYDGSDVGVGGGESISNAADYSWTQVYNAAEAIESSANASATQKAAAALLTSDNAQYSAILNNDRISVTRAQALALGLPTSPLTTGTNGYDGWVSLGSGPYDWAQNDPSKQDAVSTLEHEIAEVLGRIDNLGVTRGNAGQYTLLDLFHYGSAPSSTTGGAAPGAAAGVLNEPFVAGYNAKNVSYFSYNGSTVAWEYDTPANVNLNGADVADWESSGARSAADDSFDGVSGLEVDPPISAYDWQELNVLGYGETAPPALTITNATELPNSAAQTLTGAIDVPDAGSKISLYDGATLLGTTTANGAGAWTANVTLAGQGPHYLTAQTTNAAGRPSISNTEYLGGTGGETIGFADLSGDFASLYNTANNFDTVNGSSGKIYLTSAQVNVQGGDDTIVYSGGSGNAAKLAWTGGATSYAIKKFSAADSLALVGLTPAYAPTTTGGVDPSAFTLAINGNVVTQGNSDGSALISTFNITGQSYTTTAQTFDKSGDLTSIEYEGATGAAYSAYQFIYAGTKATGYTSDGLDLFYTNQASGLTEVDLDGAGNLTRALYAYPTTTPGTQTGFEADYVAGELASGVATYIAPGGASYSTVAAEYDNNYQYVGAVYTVNQTGQTYGEAQYSYTAGAQPKLTEATFSQYTGTGGPNVASFFYDNTGAAAGSQYSYAGITGKNYTSDTLLYNSANVLVAAQYNGYTNKSFSSQTTFYNSSGVAQEIVRDFTNPALASTINGQAYYSFETILDPTFAMLGAAYHLDDGGNVYVGFASNVSSPSFGGAAVTANAAALSNTLTGGDWTITGGGTGEIFTFASFFNKAEITDYGPAFNTATDVVSVSTQDFANWQTMLGDAAASGVGGVNTTFTSTTTGDKLTLDGVTVTQLQTLTTSQANADFFFHA